MLLGYLVLYMILVPGTYSTPSLLYISGVAYVHGIWYRRIRLKTWREHQPHPVPGTGTCWYCTHTTQDLGPRSNVRLEDQGPTRPQDLQQAVANARWPAEHRHVDCRLLFVFFMLFHQHECGTGTLIVNCCSVVLFSPLGDPS